MDDSTGRYTFSYDPLNRMQTVTKLANKTTP
jgi:hypothetical protein